MKIQFLSIAIVCLLFAGCATNATNNEGNEKKESKQSIMTTTSGLQYELLQEGTGKAPKPGDMVKVHYTGTLTDGTKFDSSVDRGEPFKFKLGAGQVIKGWDEGIALLTEGAKAKLTLTPELGYGNRQAGPIPPNSTLIFEVELLKVIEPIVAVPFNIEGKTEKTTDSGLKYYITQEAEGDFPKAGQKVVVHYTGYFEDGSKFDSSVERGDVFKFTLGAGQVIQGWDEGIGLLRVGEKARMIIPGDLAYGKSGRGSIPPNATLIFDVELVGVE